MAAQAVAFEVILRHAGLVSDVGVQVVRRDVLHSQRLGAEVDLAGRLALTVGAGRGNRRPDRPRGAALQPQRHRRQALGQRLHVHVVELEVHGAGRRRPRRHVGRTRDFAPIQLGLHVRQLHAVAVDPPLERQRIDLELIQRQVGTVRRPRRGYGKGAESAAQVGRRVRGAAHVERRTEGRRQALRRRQVQPLDRKRAGVRPRRGQRQRGVAAQSRLVQRRLQAGNLGRAAVHRYVGRYARQRQTIGRDAIRGELAGCVPGRWVDEGLDGGAHFDVAGEGAFRDAARARQPAQQHVQRKLIDVHIAGQIAQRRHFHPRRPFERAGRVGSSLRRKSPSLSAPATPECRFPDGAASERRPSPRRPRSGAAGWPCRSAGSFSGLPAC